MQCTSHDPWSLRWAPAQPHRKAPHHYVPTGLQHTLSHQQTVAWARTAAVQCWQWQAGTPVHTDSQHSAGMSGSGSCP